MQCTMHSDHILRWELYGRETAVEFLAVRGVGGFELLVKKDDSVVLSTLAGDTDTLLRQSSELRGRLLQLGFECKPRGARSSHLTGGVCWGPAAPIQSSIVDALL